MPDWTPPTSVNLVDLGFMDAFTFKFSPREGTPATRMPAEDFVSDEVASERLARLMSDLCGVAISEGALVNLTGRSLRL